MPCGCRGTIISCPYIRQSEGNYQQLSELGLTPGMKLFHSGVNYTKKKGFGRFNLAAYWKRKYRGKGEKQGWFILTNLSSIDEVIQVYQSRSGIESLFKDCKTGGYNLEGTKACRERLNRKRQPRYSEKQVIIILIPLFIINKPVVGAR